MFEKTAYRIAELRNDNKYVQAYWENPTGSNLNDTVGKNAQKKYKYKWMVFI